MRRALSLHQVETTWQCGCSELSNGDLLSAAEAAGFDLLVTTDQNLSHQRNLARKRLSIPVLMVANWPTLQPHVTRIAAAVDSMQSRVYREWSVAT